jgi:hypothetical protein
MDELKVLSEEAAHARDAISRTMGTIYTLYGVIVPASIGALALFGKNAVGDNYLDILGFLIIMLSSGALAYANALWVEAHQYLRYMYLELIPRMYRYTDLKKEKNFFQYIASTREQYTWRPAYIFQLIIVIGVLLLGFGAIVVDVLSGDLRALILLIIAIVILIAASYTSILMLKSAQTLLSELRMSTIEHVEKKVE